MNVAIYDIETGRINRFVSCNVSAISIQVGGGEEFFLNCPPETTHIVNGEPRVVAPLPPTVEVLMSGIRSERQRRLAFSDWTQMPDSPLTAEERAEWAAYRQALRDFPGGCDPVSPVWPAPPL